MYTAVHMVVIGAIKDTYYDPDEKRTVLSHSFQPSIHSCADSIYRISEEIVPQIVPKGVQDPPKTVTGRKKQFSFHYRSMLQVSKNCQILIRVFLFFLPLGGEATCYAYTYTGGTGGSRDIVP